MITNDVNKLKLLNKLGLISDVELEAQVEQPLIDIKNLHVNFKRGGKLFEAVKGANLQIQSGEILGLVGESGSGKTTLGRATLSLWDHALGSVEIDGQEAPRKRIKSVSKKNIWVYRKGQMIFQDPTSSLNRQQKVLDIVNEGQKNFQTVENEYREQIEKEEKLLREVETEIHSLDTKETFIKRHHDIYLKEHLTDIITKAKSAEQLKFIEDFNRHAEIDSRLLEIYKELEEIDGITKTKIKIIKQKVDSDKLIINEVSGVDRKFYHTARDQQIHDLKVLETRTAKDEEKSIARISKRFDSWYKKVNKRISNLTLEIKKDIPTTWDEKKVKAVLPKLEKLAVKKDKSITREERFWLKSIVIDLKVALKKREKVVSPLNTREFDKLYIDIKNIFLDRIRGYNELLESLEIRLDKEKASLNAVDKNEPILLEHYEKSVEYLEEYKGIIISLIKEFANILLNIQTWMLEQEETGIKELYKRIEKQAKINDTLKVSILTWKAEEAIKYQQRLNKKVKRELEIEIKELEQEEKFIESNYKDITNPLKDVLRIFSKDYKKLDDDYKVTDAEYNKALKTLPKLEAEIIEINDRIDALKAVLNSKEQIKEIQTKRIQETLLKVGLQDDALNKYPSQFSGGQKQRIGIARTIITQPKFIVADEPISALDVSVQAQVINLMKDIHTEMGLTMLFIAHDLQMVHYISDKIAVIYRGNIVEYGDADKVYKNPKHPYTKSLIGAMPSLEEVGKELEVSNYNWKQHGYNEFSQTKLHEVEEDHFVFGTEAEIKKWNK